MNILYFQQHFTTTEGSGGTRSYEFARYLVKKGHKVTVVTGKYKGGKTGLDGKFVFGKREGNFQGIHIIELNIEYSNRNRFLIRTFKFFIYSIRSILISLTKQYDIIFASSTPLTAGLPGIFAKIFRKKPFVFEVRDLWPELPREMGVIKNSLLLFLLDMLEKITYLKADTIIGLSPGIVEGVKKRVSKNKPIYLVPNGCDIDLFRKEYPLKEDESSNIKKFKVLYSGTHGLANGLNTLIDAAEIIQRKGINNIEILLIGDGSEKDKLIKLSRERNLKNLKFLENQKKTSLVEIMNSQDLGLQILKNIPAFYYGTSPNKFFDYMSAGLPVLTNYPGWIADLLKDYGAGYICNPDDSEDLAQKIFEASKDKNIKEKIKGASNLSDNFNRKNLSQKFEEILIKVKENDN